MTNYSLTCCFSAAVVMCGKTFMVTQQEDEESSTTTARLSNRRHRSWCSFPFGRGFLDSRSTPDITVFIVSDWGLNPERGLLSRERGSKVRGRLHVTGFYGTGEFSTRFLCRQTHTNTHTHTGENTHQMCAGVDASVLKNLAGLREIRHLYMFYEKIGLETHLFFARQKSPECHGRPGGPGDHNPEGQLSEIHIENQDNVILATLTVRRCFLRRNRSGRG